MSIYRAVRDAIGVGGVRMRAVVVLAAVLGLSGADAATVSATTAELERAFGVGNAAIGLLISVVSLIGALATVPMGMLTDRVRRTRLLATSIVAWSAALVWSGAAGSYPWLLLARLLLGVASATTGPTVSSLVGDFFPAAERARIYGLILGGELVGTGVGFVGSGEVSSLLPWRWAFWWLVIPGLLLARLVWRLPEPARGGQDRTVAGSPGPDLSGRSLWWVVGYVLRMRTNLLLIVVSAAGYFFLAGLRSFALVYATEHYGLPKPVASALVLVVGAGALLGVFAGGRVADGLQRRGRPRARIIVPVVCLLAVSPVLAPGIATTSVVLALPLLTAGGALLGAPNPPMDAARLDIVPAGLWGRAEAVRTVVRSGAESAAPALFGYLSERLAGGGPAGLESTFLLCLIPLTGAGFLLLPALRTYPRDRAAVHTCQHGGRGEPGEYEPERGVHREHRIRRPGIRR